MGIELESLRKGHMIDLYEVSKEHDPTFNDYSFDDFVGYMDKMTGWAITDSGTVIGMVGLNNINPEFDGMLHIYVSEKYKRLWLSRRLLASFFGWVFNTLNLIRCTAYVMVGLNDIEMVPFLKKLGFIAEGYHRKAIRVKGKIWDVITFSMLKEECRWI